MKIYTIIIMFLMFILVNTLASSYFGKNLKPLSIENSIGPSMFPTLPTGKHRVIINKNTIPKIGDITAFHCLAEKCRGSVNKPFKTIKRLTRIKNGCYWLQGDNAKQSFDSRYYGFLCDDELKIIGTIVGFRE